MKVSDLKKILENLDGDLELLIEPEFDGIIEIRKSELVHLNNYIVTN